MNKKLESIYLDYVNNYLTIHAFSLDYGLTDKQGSNLIKLLREIHGQSYAVGELPL